MGTITGATYNDDSTANTIKKGANKFYLTGSFSGNQADADVVLVSSLGSIDPSRTHITNQSTGSIRGNFFYSRTSVAHPVKEILGDEPGTINATVGGAPYPTNVAFPTVSIDD
jgi:hypothetical protein